MKKLFLSICALTFLMAANAQTLDRSIQPKSGPAPKINLKQPVTFTLDNGLKVFVVENHKMPIVTYSIVLDIRPKVQEDKVGLHSFVGQLLTRGTTTRNKESFDKSVDRIGASVGASGSSISGISLSKYQDSLLTLMSDALMHPAFDQKQLDKIEKQTESGLISSENNADNMLSNVVGVVNYGKNHPYGAVTTFKSIRNITLADCKQYYETYFHPNVAYMAVVGDVTPEQAKKLVTKYFAQWQMAEVPKTTYPTVTLPQENRVSFVNRAGAVQSVINVTYPIHLEIGSPNVIKASAMNQILGGGSSGRLFQNLREKHGWTYGAYSSVSSDDIIGSVSLYAKCRNAVTDSSLTEMFKEMNRIRNEKVDQETLNGVKNYLSGVFALRLESPQTIAQYAINIDRFNMPKDYYKNYLKNVDAVTVEDVQAMAQKYIHPNKANIVVVGHSSQVEKIKKFSSDGKVSYYDAYGNHVVPASAKVVNGKKIGDVLSMYINAMGGEEAIKSLKYLAVYANVKRSGTIAARMTMLTKTPDKYFQSFKLADRIPNSAQQPNVNQNKQLQSAQGNMNQAIRENSRKIVVNGDNGYREIGGEKHDLTGEALRPYQAEADLQSILHPEKYGISYALLGMTVIEGVQTYEVSKASNNGKHKAVLYINAQNGQIVMKREIEKHNGRGMLTKRYYSDYKEVKDGNGYKMPFKVKIVTPLGEKVLDINRVKANDEIKDKKFK